MVDFGKPMYGAGHSASHYFGNAPTAMDSHAYGHDHAHDDYGLPPLGVDKIGMSVPMGIAAQNVSGIYSKIRMGAGNIEIQFPGYKSGNRQAHTPEMYGTDQRTVIKEMAMANEVTFNTHASFSMMGMTGYDGGRSQDIKSAQHNLEELKTAIDFQADISKGGSVVMHTGEFDRPITDMYLDDETGHLNLSRDENGRLMFRQYLTQEGAATFTLMDDRTHQTQTMQRDRLVSYPLWRRAKSSYRDMDGNLVSAGDYIDYENKLIKNPYDATNGRVPDFDDSGFARVELRSFDYFRQEAEEYNKWFEKQHGRSPNYYEKLYPEEAFARAPIETNEAQSRGYSRYSRSYGANLNEQSERLVKLREAKKFYEELDKTLAPDEKWKIMKSVPEALTGLGLMPSENKHPVKLINDEIDKTENQIYYLRTSISASENQAKELAESKSHIIAPIKRLERHGVRLYAEAGIHAARRTEDGENPVVVAIEHIFPEQFGGHPEELKWIIKKSRERMVDLMTTREIEAGSSLAPAEWEKDKYGYDPKTGEPYKQPNPFFMNVSREEAEKIAEKHLKATIDTGHINLWRKYWQDDASKTPEQNDRAFKDWVVKSIDTLAKENMIGNVHLADNYGYHDDHLSPGQGNSPVREIVNTIRKYGYDKAITVEPGADATTDQSDFHGLMKTWRYFGSPVYGMGGMGGSGNQRWGDIQASYFGQGRSPDYIFGGYAPSNEWSLWSQVPLE